MLDIISIIVCFMSKQIRTRYANVLYFLISSLLITPVIIPLLPLHRAGQANAVRTHLSVRLMLLLTRCLATKEMLACKTEQGPEELRMWHLEKYDNLSTPKSFNFYQILKSVFWNLQLLNLILNLWYGAFMNHQTNSYEEVFERKKETVKEMRVNWLMMIKIPWDPGKLIVKSAGHWINIDLKSQSLLKIRYTWNMFCENRVLNTKYISFPH